MKKIYLTSLLILATVSILSFGAKQAHADTTNLKGWGWSSNIGWISFSSANVGQSTGGQYNVTLSTTTNSNTGTFGGYAWSSNIGWIKFAGDASHPNPTVDLSTGDVTGWMRACAGTMTGDCNGASRTDGWDGWIHLSDPTGHPTRYTDGSKGVSFNPATGIFNGYAWGSDVVGWLTFGTQITPGQEVHCKPGVDCPNPPGGPGTLSVTCLGSAPTGSVTATWSASISGGNQPYTYTWNGTNHNSTYSQSGTAGAKLTGPSLTVTSGDGQTQSPSCPDVTLGGGENSGLNMWIQGTTNGSRLSTITIRSGSNAVIKWGSVGNDSYLDCEGHLPPLLNSLNIGDITTNESYTMVRPPVGSYTFYMSCLNQTKSINEPAVNPIGGDKLRIIVKDSTIEEI